MAVVLSYSPEVVWTVFTDALAELTETGILGMDDVDPPWAGTVTCYEQGGWSVQIQIDEGPTQSRLQATSDDEAVQQPLADLLARFEEVLRGPPTEPPDDFLSGFERRVREVLHRRLFSAPDAVAAVLRPRAIAIQETLPVADVFAALETLRAAEMVSGAWVPLCPTVQPPDLLDGERHCAACGIRDDDDLAQHVEAVYLPLSSVRVATPIVRSMERRKPVPLHALTLAPGAAKRSRMTVRPGRYLFQGGGSTLLLDVDSAHAPADRAILMVGPQPTHVTVAVPVGSQPLRFENGTSREVEVRVTRRWRPALPLTAAIVFSEDAFAGHRSMARMSTTRALMDGCVVYVETATSEDFTPTRSIFQSLRASHFERRENHLVAFFPRIEDALLAAEQLMVRQLDVGVGLAVGICEAVGDPFELRGPAVDEAIEALRQADRPQHAVHAASVPAVRAVIEHHARVIHLRPRSGSSALLLYAAVIDGAPLLAVPTMDPERVKLPPLPDKLKNYTVGEPIDRGGVASIVEADGPRGPCVVKVLHAELATRNLVRMFNRECYYSSQLDHPNIVQTYDWGEADGLPYLVLERLDGMNLHRLVRAYGPLPLGEVVSLTLGLLDALDHVHAKGWVHRDIKPHNVFRLEDKQTVPYGVKLLDFGLTRPAGRSSTEHFAGTPEFMAPEQLELGHIDHRADLFGVGALMFYLATAKPPFKGKSRGEGAVLRLGRGVRTDVDPELLGPLVKVVEAALEIEAYRRWPDARTMRAAICEVCGIEG